MRDSISNSPSRPPPSARRSGRREPLPPRDASADGRRHWRAALAVVLVAAGVRMLLAGVTPLVPDEAYYWEWSRRLATGYFDHPPMIALLVWAGTALFGATPLGVRFVPVLAGAAAMMLVVDLARRHGGARAALHAAVIATCVPVAAAGLVLATPDAPLMLAYAATLWALDRALAAPTGSGQSWTWWTLAGAGVGFGLLSKYTVVLLPLGVLIAFLARRTLRARLRTPEPYAAGTIALATFVPVVAWNARHEWASFAFQLRHGLGSSGGSALGRELNLLLEQLVLVSPILFVLLGFAVARALVRGSDDRRFTLAVIACTTFGFFVYSALRQRVEPNWPAPAYLPGFVLLALATAAGAWRRWLRGGAALGGAMALLIYLQSLAPVLPVRPHKDPMARGAGWEVLAGAVERELRTGTRDADRRWVAANRYQDAALLAFHLPGNPTVFSLNLENRPNQYDYWPSFAERAEPGESLVLVLEEWEGVESILHELRPHFGAVRRRELVEMRRGEGLITERRIWVLEGWEGSWPERRHP